MASKTSPNIPAHDTIIHDLAFLPGSCSRKLQGVMCSGNEMTEALLFEQRELVGRLDALAARIHQDKDPASKARSKVEYAEERAHYVQLLRKVQPSPYSFSSACKLEHPSPYVVGMCEPANSLIGPISRSLRPYTA